MMEQQNAKSEMDLIVLCVKMFDWIKGVLKSILNFFVILVRIAWKKKLVMLIALILGVLAGYAFVEYEDYEYKIEAESQLRINTTDAITVHEVMTSYDNLCKNKRYAQLAEMLNVDKADAEKIKRVEAFYWIDGRHDGNATSVDKKETYIRDSSIARMTDRLQIKVTTSDIDMLPRLSSILRNSISENERIKYRHDLRLEADTKLAEHYALEAVILDSLRKIEYFGAMSDQSKVQIDGPMIVSNKDKQLYHDQIMTLHGYFLDYQNRVKRNAYCAEFVNEFVMTKISPRWLKVPAIGGLAFVVLATFGCYFVSRRKKIVAFLEKEN